LSLGVQVVGATWRAMMRIIAEDWGWSHRSGNGRIGQVLSGRTIERSGDAVYGMHYAYGDEECEFLG
jgi:hypothetical protein